LLSRQSVLIASAPSIPISSSTGLDGAKELYRSGDIDFDMILFDGSRVYVSEGIASGFSTDMDKEIITRQP
jgi:thiamine biosynthesis lipoprotein